MKKKKTFPVTQRMDLHPPPSPSSGPQYLTGEAGRGSTQCNGVKVPPSVADPLISQASHTGQWDLCSLRGKLIVLRLSICS